MVIPTQEESHADVHGRSRSLLRRNDIGAGVAFGSCDATTGGSDGLTRDCLREMGSQVGSIVAVRL